MLSIDRRYSFSFINVQLPSLEIIFSDYVDLCKKLRAFQFFRGVLLHEIKRTVITSKSVHLEYSHLLKEVVLQYAGVKKYYSNMALFLLCIVSNAILVFNAILVRLLEWSNGRVYLSVLICCSVNGTFFPIALLQTNIGVGVI